MELFLIITEGGTYSEGANSPEAALTKHCDKHKHDLSKLKVVDVIQYQIADRGYNKENLQSILQQFGGSFKSLDATQDTVMLIDYGSAKLKVTKTLMDHLGVGLKAAKSIVNRTPGPVYVNGLDRDSVNVMCEELEKHGATVINHHASRKVALLDAGPAKLKVVKELKTIFGIGLKEAKGFVDAVPCVIPYEMDNIQDVLDMLRAVGAQAQPAK